MRMCLATALLLWTLSALSQSSEYTENGVEFVGEAVTPVVVTVNMRALAEPHSWRPGDPIREIPFRYTRPKGWQRPPEAPRGYGMDPLAQRQMNLGSSLGGSMFSNTIVNVDGLGFTGVNPSDTNGDVGIDHYIQSINNGSSSGILILNKVDGTVAAQFVLDSIAAGSGTGCGGGTGDPVILFDQFADNGVGNPKGRWVLTEFTGNSLCIYVSQTHDPIGPNNTTWFVYEFISQTGGLPDYPKFGVWNDAYYVGANENNRQYALDRTNMLQGNTTRPYQVVSTVGLPGFSFQHMMPADADGEVLPPAGAPGIFMRHRDSEYHGAPGADDVLELWEFDVDFDTPANTVMSGPTNIVVSEFDTHLGGTNFGDLSVPQPTGTNLFPLKQPLMWRVQHRTIDNTQYLVGNMVTDVDGNDYHGVRWWVLERPAATTSGGWTLSDEGTYTLNDGVHRWMASAAMDGSGNLAIGYNVSDDTSVFPGMRYAGRLSTDPPGVLPHGENLIISGTSSNGSSRYGDYSSLNVDPVDDCTFWYTAQYNPASQWDTRVASFRFEQCGCQLSLDVITVNSAAVTDDNEITVSWNDSLTPEITEYRVMRSTTSGSGYALIDTVSDTSPGVAGGAGYTYIDNDVSAGTEYFYIIKAGDGGACVTTDSNEVSAVATGVCTLAPEFAGVSAVNNQATPGCAIEVNWNGGASLCPNGAGDLRYSVYRSTVSGFTPSLANRIATDINGLAYVDGDASLVSDTDYYYVVRATDLDNALEEDNLVEDSTFPTGPITPQPFDDDLESYTNIGDAEAAGWDHFADVGADDWRIESGDDHSTGTGNAFVSTDVTTASDKSLVTRQFSPSATTELIFFHKHDFEIDTVAWDGGVLEITVDGGSNWSDLGAQITQGGYNVTLDGSGGANPLGAVSAWGGLQSTFTEVRVDLSPFSGQLVQLRWRMGTDAFVGGGEWKIDDIEITDSGSFGQCNVIDLIFANSFD